MEIVRSEGADRLTIRGLAARLGVAVTAIYWHVGDKQALLDGVVDRIIEELGEVTVEGRTAEDRVLSIGRSLRASLLARPDLVALVHRQGRTASLFQPARRVLVHELTEADSPPPTLPGPCRPSWAWWWARSWWTARSSGHRRSVNDPRSCGRPRTSGPTPKPTSCWPALPAHPRGGPVRVQPGDHGSGGARSLNPPSTPGSTAQRGRAMVNPGGDRRGGPAPDRTAGVGSGGAHTTAGRGRRRHPRRDGRHPPPPARPAGAVDEGAPDEPR